MVSSGKRGFTSDYNQPIKLSARDNSTVRLLALLSERGVGSDIVIFGLCILIFVKYIFIV